MTTSGPHSEGFFCVKCQIHRTMSSIGLCPSCADQQRRDLAEAAAAKDAGEREASP